MAEPPKFSAAHCRAARSLLNITQAGLAEMSEVGRMTVKRFEGGEAVRPAQAAAMRLALEGAGLVFVPDGFLFEGRPVIVGVLMIGSETTAPS